MKQNVRSIVLTEAYNLQKGQEIAIERDKWPTRAHSYYEGDKNFMHLHITEVKESITGTWIDIKGYMRENPSYSTVVRSAYTKEWLVIYEAVIDWDE